MASRSATAAPHDANAVCGFSNHAGGHEDPDEADIVEQVRGNVTRLQEAVSAETQDWGSHISEARSIIATLGQAQFFQMRDRLTEQTWILGVLQDLAYHDADNGCVQDMADFCQTAWLRVLRQFPENVQALSGLASNWLQRAQATLARIHREEDSSSSSGGSGTAASVLSDIRRQGALYVDARSLLYPAVDFYNRAVRAADSCQTTTGDLLAQAAEAHMNLGNVSDSPENEQHFAKAIRYLRRAATTPGYTLSYYLAQYLNEYGRYVS